ncbi:hypothetical protein QJQ45_012140 [Haematococcus lacustris]|nr:hypothetical protein QJQ45_012140 [Haematococcus lacustris]
MAENVSFVVLARVKACSERAVLGSLLLGFFVRDLFTLHAADQLDEQGQPVYTDILVSQAAIPDLKLKKLVPLAGAKVMVGTNERQRRFGDPGWDRCKGQAADGWVDGMVDDKKYKVTPAIGCTPVAQEIPFLLISARMRPPIASEDVRGYWLACGSAVEFPHSPEQRLELGVVRRLWKEAEELCAKLAGKALRSDVGVRL